MPAGTFSRRMTEMREKLVSNREDNSQWPRKIVI